NGLRTAPRPGRPSVEGGLEAGVDQQVLPPCRQRQIGERIGRVKREAGRALPGHLIEDTIVVAGTVEETRLGGERVDDGSADRVQVELEDILLPVEDISEVLDPVNQLTRARGV